MAVKIEMRLNEPIIILTYVGKSDVADIQKAFAQTVRYIDQMNGRKVYRISDIRQAEVDFTDILDLIRFVTENSSGSSVDPRTESMFVGDSKLLRIYSEVLRQNGYNVDGIPFFDTMEKALDYVRVKMAEE
jgi:hypothetical protein